VDTRNATGRVSPGTARIVSLSSWQPAVNVPARVLELV
jgi:hypothetical protein